MGRPMILCGHSRGKPTHGRATEGGDPVASDLPSKTRWEAENVIKLTVKINRNQDPQLFEIFTREHGSRSALAKALMNKAITEK